MFKKIFSILLLIFFVVPRVDAQTEKAKQTVVARLRLGDRFYIESVLNEIFGPSIEPITNKYIYLPASSFGGPCDPYEQVRIGSTRTELAEPRSLCPEGKGAANLPVIPSSQMMRQGYIAQACREITDNLNAVNFALANAVKSINNNAPVNEKNVTDVFHLFYPTKQPSPEVVEALSKINSGKNETKTWSKILYTLCIDPAWQII
ncbi:MAG: hypothetical protein ACXVAX_07505 [Pseudobdellovibrio sp.]